MRKGYLILLVIAVMMLSSGCTALQVRYTEGYKERGIASWYGKEFHGVTTAKKDEKFDMNAMTTAHRRIPFNSTIKVTNRDNGKSVVVRVNDRGPTKRERIVDLSYAAFKKIADPDLGLISVEIEIIRLGE